MNEQRAMPVAGDHGGDARRVDLDGDRVCIRRRIAGVESRVNVPICSYRGVTLRATPGDRFEIVLLHLDPNLDITLVRALDDSDVIAQWRGFGRTIGLPLLVEDQAGRLQTVEDRAAAVRSGRRRGSPLRARRPRFLARRRAGCAGGGIVHRGERDLMAAP